MPATTAIASSQSHSHAAAQQQARRNTPRQRPVGNRLHTRSHSSTKLATAGLAFTQVHTDTPPTESELKAKRRIKSAEDVTLMRPHSSSASLNKLRPSSRSSKHSAFNQHVAEDHVKVPGGTDDDEWTSESGASSPIQTLEESDDLPSSNTLEDESGRHTPVPNRSPTPTLQPSDEGARLTILTEFPRQADQPHQSVKTLYRSPRSPHTPGRLRPMSLIRPPSFASAVVTAPPVLDKQTAISGPNSPASDIHSDSPQTQSSHAHRRSPSGAPSIASVPPSIIFPTGRVRTTSTFSSASGQASRAIDALSRASNNPYLASHFPHQVPVDNVHHLLPRAYVKSHLALKRFWSPVDEAVARVRPALQAS